MMLVQPALKPKNQKHHKNHKKQKTKKNQISNLKNHCFFPLLIICVKVLVSGCVFDRVDSGPLSQRAAIVIKQRSADRNRKIFFAPNGNGHSDQFYKHYVTLLFKGEFSWKIAHRQ